MFCAAFDHLGDIGKIDRGAFVIAHDQRLVVVRMGDLVVGNNVRRSVPSVI